MAFKNELTTKFLKDGQPYTMLVIDNPTIEDVLVVEARITASEVMNGTSDPNRVVDREVRDLLIRLGVDR